MIVAVKRLCATATREGVDEQGRTRRMGRWCAVLRVRAGVGPLPMADHVSAKESRLGRRLGRASRLGRRPDRRLYDLVPEGQGEAASEGAGASAAGVPTGAASRPDGLHGPTVV